MLSLIYHLVISNLTWYVLYEGIIQLENILAVEDVVYENAQQKKLTTVGRKQKTMRTFKVWMTLIDEQFTWHDPKLHKRKLWIFKPQTTRIYYLKEVPDKWNHILFKILTRYMGALCQDNPTFGKGYLNYHWVFIYCHSQYMLNENS